jgi:hypothetical protein
VSWVIKLFCSRSSSSGSRAKFTAIRRAPWWDW